MAQIWKIGGSKENELANDGVLYLVLGQGGEQHDAVGLALTRDQQIAPILILTEAELKDLGEGINQVLQALHPGYGGPGPGIPKSKRGRPKKAA